MNFKFLKETDLLLRSRRLWARKVWFSRDCLYLLLFVLWLGIPGSSFAEKDALAKGVIIEEIGTESPFFRSGFREGDKVISWRLGWPLDSDLPSFGVVKTPFEWNWLATEVAPRGPIIFDIERAGHRFSVFLESDWWDVKVRPNLPKVEERLFSKGLELIDSGARNQGLALWRKLNSFAVNRGDFDTAAWVDLRIGLVWAKAGDRKRAEIEYRKGLDYPIGTIVRMRLIEYLAVNAHYASEYSDAKKFRLQALRLQESRQNFQLHSAETLGWLGRIEKEIGDLREGISYYQQALRIVERAAPGSATLAIITNGLGTISSEAGDLISAEGFYLKTLEILKHRAPDSNAVAGCVFNLGVVAFRRRDFDLAEDYWLEVLSLRSKSVPGTLDHANVLSALGELNRFLENLEAAQAFHEQALQIQREMSPGGLTVAVSLYNLANIQLERNNSSKAKELFEEALEIQNRLAPESLDVATTLYSLGKVAELDRSLEVARRLFERSLAIRSKLAPGTIQESHSLSTLARLSRREGAQDESLSLYMRAITSLEEQLGRLGGAWESEVNLKLGVASIYKECISLAVSMGQTEKAFRVLERYKGYVFGKLLSERQLSFHRDLPTELEESRRGLSRELSSIYGRLSDVNSSLEEKERNDLARELTRKRREWIELLGKIEKTKAGSSPVRFTGQLDSQDVRAFLDSGTTVLSYCVTADEVLLFVLSENSELRVMSTGVRRSELMQLVKSYISLAGRNWKDTGVRGSRILKRLELSSDLFEILLGPALPFVREAKRILILPDGFLHRLPFAALSRPTKTGVRYLADWKPIHQALSATVYAELRTHRSNIPRSSQVPVQLAAFGDPQPSQSGGRRIDDLIVRSLIEHEGFRLPALPFSRFEVERIVDVFGSDKGHSFVGREASEQRFRALASRARILHIATHALINEQLPMSSFVALSIPESIVSGEDNGLLQVWEILEDLRIDADLVVLSACKSGLGESLGPEGLIGLTRAFQYAGARSVLASLWDVSDRSTAELMIRFYKHLTSGLTKDEALRAAQIEFIQGPIEIEDENGEMIEVDYSSPYHWAAFQVYGDWK